MVEEPHQFLARLAEGSSQSVPLWIAIRRHAYRQALSPRADKEPRWVLNRPKCSTHTCCLSLAPIFRTGPGVHQSIAAPEPKDSVCHQALGEFWAQELSPIAHEEAR